jgi:putative oxidoreductase
MSIKALITKLYGYFLIATNSTQSAVLLAIRLYWGWQFFITGKGKFADIPKVIDFFTSLGIPAPALNAYFVSGLELVGGVLLILGLGSRLIALPLFIDMVVAYVTADREALMSIFSEPDKFMNAAPFTFMLASLIILSFGPGKVALDTLVAKYLNRDAIAAEAAAGNVV